MIYNVELLHFWRREEQQMKYIQCIEYQYLTGDGIKEDE